MPPGGAPCIHRETGTEAQRAGGARVTSARPPGVLSRLGLPGIPAPPKRPRPPLAGPSQGTPSGPAR
eukprot:2134130-Lingulodinium_polyedra.AAC.1